MGYDMNDLAKDQGPAAVRALLERAAPPLPEDHPAPAFTKPEKPPAADDYQAEDTPPDPGPAYIEPPPEDDEEITIGKRLAAMGDFDYDRQRENIAKELRVRAPTLDKLRNRFLPKSLTDLPGTAIELYEPLPWPRQVKGPEVFSEVYSVIRKFVVIPHELAVIVTFWTVHAHVFDVFDHTPRLTINAAEHDCGKTVLAVGVIANLVPRPQTTEDLTPPTFYRIIEQHRPTIIGDEFDELMKKDPALIGGINGGWEPHGGALRCVGDNQEVRKFSTYSPCLMAGKMIVNLLPATTLSRSFVITLERATPGETFTPMDKSIHYPEIMVIGRKLARWCLDHRERIRQTRPQLPERARNRKADKWRPFFALAEIAGGEWPQRAIEAFEFVEREEVESLTKELELLSNIHDVMKDKESYIHTEELITRLCEIDESRWLDYNFKDKDSERRKIKPRQIAELLKGYKIMPRLVGPRGYQRRGYNRDDLEPAWRRYLPKPPQAKPTPQDAEIF